MGFTQEQKTVLFLAAAGLIAAGAGFGYFAVCELDYDMRETMAIVLAALGIAGLVAAWATARVLKLRK
jgi:hypothetical protein